MIPDQAVATWPGSTRNSPPYCKLEQRCKIAQIGDQAITSARFLAHVPQRP